MLSPLSLNLTTMVPEPTDPLLNVWRMQWNAQAMLQGPAGLANIFNTNIFYPYPLTLAYSEHFLLLSAQALPFLLLPDSHLVGLNLSVLLTFVLSGYGMYLLITAWSGNRWAGLLAGLLFAFSPQRFGQLNHLELLVTQWLPLALLALHWTLTRPGRRYAALFILFFNLQALSNFHFTLNLALACALLALLYALTGRIRWRPGLWVAGLLSVGITLLLNWPIWRMYLRFSDVMGAVRTPGEVRIYSAALTDYLTAIPYNLLYGWTFGRWPLAGHQVQPLMPFGLVGSLLALLALILITFYVLRRFSWFSSAWPRARGTNSHLLLTPYFPPSGLFLFLMTLLGLLLSFGLNENALGPSLAPLLAYSPYGWLYEQVTIFQGIRVPGRYSILVLIGLVGLAGWGVAWLFDRVSESRPSPPTPLPQKEGSGVSAGLRVNRAKPYRGVLFGLGLASLILLEAWSAPLVGPEFPAGANLPPVYDWLRRETPAEAVVLELPFQGPSEFLYEYYASHHWRRLVNGGTGFTPPVYKALRQSFNTFPDAASLDAVQQLGVDFVVLHPAAYGPEAWSRILDDLPRYLPQFEAVQQVGDDFVVRLAEPACAPDPEQISVSLAPAELDGIANAVAVTYYNAGPAAFVAEVNRVSHLTFTAGPDKNFTEPLLTPAGGSQTVTVPLPDDQPGSAVSGAWLATLDRVVATVEPETPTPEVSGAWQPLGLAFSDGPQLAAIQLHPAQPAPCGHLTVGLAWQGGRPEDTAIVQLLDPFGRLVVEDKAQPWQTGATEELRQLSLVGALPPGRYGLRVRVFGPDGQERPPMTGEGVPIPPDQLPPLPVTIHPPEVPESVAADGVTFGQTIRLLESGVAQRELRPGEWLRLNLTWQATGPLERDLTVFTQLLGPDGQVWGQQDNQPGGGWYSTSLWRPDRPVPDAYAFPLRAGAPPGSYRVIVGWYDSVTQERLLTASGADFVEIGPVTVP